MRSLIGYFVRHPVSGNILMVLILLFGWFGLKNIRSSFFPLVDSRVIVIQAVYPGASPVEIEEGITLKIEDNLKSISGLDRITSTSSENTTRIIVEFNKGYKMSQAIQDVKNAVESISSFPTGMEPPVVFLQENLNFAASFAISGSDDLGVLKKHARKAESDLRAIDGVSKIEISGFPDEEIEISFSEDDLRAFNLTFSEALTAVARSNILISGGVIKGPAEELLIRTNVKGYNAIDLYGITLKSTPDGKQVKLEDVAAVRDQWADSPLRNYLNGKPAVVITVSSTADEDILAIADHIKNYVGAFKGSASNIKATIIRDGTVPLVQRIELLLKNGMIGAFLVLMFLALFLNLRLAFWVAVAIPVSFMGMFILAHTYGLTINVISLFGMILVIGILVDEGIVVAENIYQHHELGKSRVLSAVDGTMEVLPAVTAAVLTTIVAFISFFFIEGRLGDFMTDMAFVVIGTLTFSLIESAFILPAHVAHSKALQPDLKKHRSQHVSDKVMIWLRDHIYAPVLKRSLSNTVLALAVPVGLFIITIGALNGGVIKSTFFPFIERDDLNVQIEMPAGTPIDLTSSWLDKIIEDAWLVNNEYRKNREDSLDIIINIEKRTGPLSHQGTVIMSLLDAETRNVKSFEISNAIRTKVGPVYGAENVVFGTATPFGKPISVSLLGNNVTELEAVKIELKEQMAQLSTLRDVTDSDQRGLREINIKLKPKAILLGLRPADVINQVRNGFFGAEVQRLQRGEDEVKVWVRYGQGTRKSISSLSGMFIRTSSGQNFPLSEIAEFEFSRGVMAIAHLDGKREIRVEAELADPTVIAPDVINEIKETILPPILAKHSSIKTGFEGQSRESNRSQKSIAKVMPIILLIMFSIVVFTFGSVLQALMVFLILPLGFIGVGWGHYVEGLPISMLSVFGVIALIGIMVNDALVLVSTMNRLMKDGLSFDEAVYRAGLMRFRPILLTSVTTIAGLGPLLIEKSFQAQFLIPMATSVAYGLIAATVLTLITLPVLLVILNRIKIYVTYAWTGAKPVPEEVEPAIEEFRHEHE
jgi:multidrug efflux pump subunit AcrB